MFGKNRSEVMAKLKKRGLLKIAILFAFCVVVSYLLDGLTFHSQRLVEMHGFSIGFDNLALSTALSRQLLEADQCDAVDKPCMVYVTLPQNSTQGMMVSFQVNTDS